MTYWWTGNCIERWGTLSYEISPMSSQTFVLKLLRIFPSNTIKNGKQKYKNEKNVDSNNGIIINKNSV